jgi:hypothetical protein
VPGMSRGSRVGAMHEHSGVKLQYSNVCKAWPQDFVIVMSRSGERLPRRTRGELEVVWVGGCTRLGSWDGLVKSWDCSAPLKRL